MKTNHYLVFAAAAVLAIATSCQSSEKPAGNLSRNIWTISTEASFSAPESKALDENGTEIIATFSTAEKIYAYNKTKSARLSGFLQPQTDGASTILKGTLTGSIEKGDELKFIYLQSDISYNGQDGTLEGIAESFDFATAIVTVNDVSTPDITTTGAEFNTLQSITKFTFPFPVQSLTIKGHELVQSIDDSGVETFGDITVSLTSASTEVYVALRNSSGEKQTYNFDITSASSKTYAASKRANLLAGENYTASITPHEYVDMGTSVKWAASNLGALSDTDYGNYFAWGESSAKQSYTWLNYTYQENVTPLPLEYDAARNILGGDWRFPTKAEWDELRGSDFVWSWQNDYKGSGHNGYLVTGNRSGYEGRSIFLPAGGLYHHSGGSLIENNSSIAYWSASTVLPDGYYYYRLSAYRVYGQAGNVLTDSPAYRCEGNTVRPVF